MFRPGYSEVEKQRKELERNKNHRLFSKLSEAEMKAVQELLLSLELINAEAQIEKLGVRFSLIGRILEDQVWEEKDEVGKHTTKRIPGGVMFSIVNDAAAGTDLRRGAVDFLILELNYNFLTKEGERLFGMNREVQQLMAEHGDKRIIMPRAEIDIGPDVFSFFISGREENDSYALAAAGAANPNIVLLNPPQP